MKLKSKDLPFAPFAYRLIVCPYGVENCDEDDFESMCDDCKQDRAECIADARADTYD